MAKFILLSVRKITHADWLLNDRDFTVLTAWLIQFLFRTDKFGGKIFELILMKFRDRINQRFRVMECAGTL